MRDHQLHVATHACKKAAAYATLVLSAMLAAMPAHAAVAGATSGQIDVTPTGAAQYTIPIAVPPGIAGMEPKLALTYNSQGKNGLEGVGWSLSGLSTITRCPRTLVQDGIMAGVNYDTNDKYCLDGQRLVAINGAYGANGTEYRTERETFSRVISYGSNGYGPLWFKVWTKSGQIIEFGNTPDSAIEAQGKVAIGTWAVNKVSDGTGNYLTVTYTEDNPNGQYYPAHIDYAYVTLALGPVATKSVRFAYNINPRADIVPSYQAGSLSQYTVLLTNIQTYAGTTLVKDYHLAYNQSSATLRSRLAVLMECDGAATPACLRPTTFNWQEGGANYANQLWAGYGMTTSGSNWADLNGDGKVDYVTNDANGHHYVGLSTGTGYQNQVWSGHGISTTGAHWVDLNGDGKADYVTSDQYGNHYVSLSTGTGYQNQLWSGQGISTTGAHWVDLNGDGKADYVTNDQYGNHYVSLSTGTGYQNQIWSGHGIAAYGTYWADVNGDGKSDYITIDQYGNYYISFSTGTGFQNAIWKGQRVSTTGAHWADLNGDGKADFVTEDAVGTHYISISTGTGFINYTWAGQGLLASGSNWVDLNGDGKADFVTSDQYGLHYVSLSTGTGLQNQVWRGNGIAPSGMTHWADMDGDGKADYVSNDQNGNHYVSLVNAPYPDLLTSVADGLGAVVALTYKPLTDSTVYTKDSTAASPVEDLQSPMYVVASVSKSDGVGGVNVSNYTYAGAKTHLTGGGFLGFRQILAVDAQTGITTATTYRQDYPHQGLPLATQKLLGGAVLSQSSNIWAFSTNAAWGAPYHVPLLTQTNVATYELPANGGAPVTQSTTCKSYDGYGNATQIAEWAANVADCAAQPATAGQFVNQTTNTYGYDLTSSFLGRVTSLVVTNTNNTPTATATRISAYAYDTVTGLLSKDVVAPNDRNLCLANDYLYDAYGNRSSTTTRNCNGSANEAAAPVAGSDAIFAARTSTVAYLYKKADGSYGTVTTNAQGHTEIKSYEGAFGKVVSLTGPNGLTTAWAYDTFGRKTLETRADGTSTSWASVAIAGPGDPNAPATQPFAAYLIATTQSGEAQPSYVYYDSLNRKVLSSRRNMANTDWVDEENIAYDNFGNAARTYHPYERAQFSSARFSTATYDVLGRVSVETAADGSATSHYYAGLRARVINALNQMGITVRNVLGQVVMVVDAAGNTISYAYDPFGNLIQTTDPLGNVISLSYDLRGRKIGQVDPDTGTWSYSYNAAGDLVRQVDANQQTVTMQYDQLGRMVNRSERDLVSNWTYDTAVMGIGKLAVASTTAGYSRTYTYDAFGRQSSISTIIDNPAAPYLTSTTYDSAGRIATQTYPASPGYPTGFAVKNVYNAVGYLAEVRDNATNRLYWQANAMDAAGHLTQQTYGNGIVTQQMFDPATGRVMTQSANVGTVPVQYMKYAYDSLGNLQIRVDGIAGLSESFLYDSVNRVTAATAVSATANTMTTFAYDAIGNIISKSDVGAYTYNASGAGSIQPHAVASITGTVNGVVNPTYRYDPNGNMLNGAGRTIAWTNYNMPSQITSCPAGGAACSTVGFWYNSDHERIKELQADQSVVITLSPRYDTGLHFEKKYIARNNVLSGEVEYEHYLYANGQMFGKFVVTTATDGVTVASTQTEYYLKDHLGSVVARLDGSGAVIERLSYDVWGKRRNADGSPATIVNPDMYHGYTGHEMLDAVALVHMNGRLFDPQTGRFLSADPVVQDPGDLQSFNRYSYASNNPLSRMDPSGYSWWTKHRQVVVQVVAGLADATFCLGLCSAAVGAYYGYQAGGWEGAIIGGVAGYLGAQASAQYPTNFGVQGEWSFGMGIQNGALTVTAKFAIKDVSLNVTNLLIGAALSHLIDAVGEYSYSRLNTSYQASATNPNAQFNGATPLFGAAGAAPGAPTPLRAAVDTLTPSFTGTAAAGAASSPLPLASKSFRAWKSRVSDALRVFAVML